MVRRLHGERGEILPFRNGRQVSLLVVAGSVGIIDVFDVGLQESAEEDGATGRRELAHPTRSAVQFR